MYYSREMAYNVLTKVACQLQTNGGYNWLRCEVNSIIENKEKKCSLNFSLKTWTDVAERLQVSLKEFEEEFEVQKKEYQEEIERMAQEIDASFCDNVDKLGKIMDKNYVFLNPEDPNADFSYILQTTSNDGRNQSWSSRICDN